MANIVTFNHTLKYAFEIFDIFYDLFEQSLLKKEIEKQDMMISFYNNVFHI